MGAPRTKVSRRQPEGRITGFDVVRQQTVGHVEFGNGDMPWQEAALGIIGRDMAKQEEAPAGEYSFPGEDGDTIRVTVVTDLARPEFDDPKEAVEYHSQRLHEAKRALTEARNETEVESA